MSITQIPVRAGAVLLLALATSGCPGEDKETETDGTDTDGSDTDGSDTEETDGNCELTEFALPGSEVYPEGIARSADGTMYIGSLSTGALFTNACAETADTLLAAGGLRAPVGMVYDEDRSTLWVCNSDLTFSAAPQVLGLDPSDGSVTVTHEYAGGFCNDLTLDASGNLYFTDSLGHFIGRVPAADVMVANSAEVWSSDASYDAGAGFGLNGIVAEGDSHVFAVNLTLGELYRVGIATDGSAEAPVAISLDRPLVSADGLKQRSPTVLHVLENSAGNLVQIDLSGDSGTVTTIDGTLDAPTTFAYGDDGDAWVVEGQLDHLFGGDTSPPNEPFRVVRVTIP